MSVNDSESTQRIRLDLGYDGTDFAGWAKQPGRRTVQGELEEALGILTRVEKVSLTVGGRTDAGVHARGQVAHFDIPTHNLVKLYGNGDSLDPRWGAKRLNGVLKKLGSEDVLLHTATPVSDAFDARFSAVARRYEYRLESRRARRDPLRRRYTVQVTDELDIGVMNEAARGLVGLRDFATFCKPRDGATTVRELEEFFWTEPETGVFVARLKADAFCHSMVRALVGACTAVGAGRITIEDLRELADNRERTPRFRVLGSSGLSLEEIYYPDEDEYGARAEQTRAKRSPVH